VAILWRKHGQWFKGKIHKFSETTKKHFVKYEDGDQAEVNLARERFQFLTNPKPGAAPNSTYHGSPKGKDAVGFKVKVYWPGMCRWYVGRVKEYDRATGKHLIAYQDGEQHLILLRNEAVKFPHLESKSRTSLKPSKSSGKAAHNSKNNSPPVEKIRRTSHRGKRVAADCQHSGDSAQTQANGGNKRSKRAASHEYSETSCDKRESRSSKKLRSSSRSVLARHQEESSIHNDATTSMEEDNTAMTSTYLDNKSPVPEMSMDNTEDSMKDIQCPKTPDNDTCGIMERHMEPSKSTSCEGDHMSEEGEMAEGVSNQNKEPNAQQQNKTDAVQMKAEVAKVKAMKAKEIAARKAEEAAKALAAVAALQKAEASSPQGKDAVGWRVGIWSPEEHKYFKGRVIGFDEASGEHKLEFDGGRVDSFLLDQQRTKWMNKTKTMTLHPPRSATANNGSRSPTTVLDTKVLKDLVGKHIRVHRGQESPVGKVIAFSASRQKYLILFMDSKHEWSDLKRNNWELCDTVPGKPEHLPVGMGAISWRVGIFWPRNEKFFNGQITNFEPSSNQHLVHYDDGEESWLNLDEVDVKWFTRSSKSPKTLNSVKSMKVATKKAQNVLNEHAIEIMSCHPEIFAHSRTSIASEKLDVLSNIHNSCGLMTPLEEISMRQKPNKSAAHSLPVHSVDDVWGVKVIPSNMEEDTTSDNHAEERMALSHRLQVLEFMIEHSSHAETSVLYPKEEGPLEGDKMMKKEDIQPLEPVDSLSLSNLGRESSWTAN